MSTFTIKIEGLENMKRKMDAETLYGPILRHNLDTLGQVALGLARGRAPRKSNAMAGTLNYEVSKAPMPHWSKVTFNPAAGSKGFRYGYALDQGGAAGGRAYHYRGTGKATFGWLHKIRPLMQGAISSAASAIAREIEGKWRQ